MLCHEKIGGRPVRQTPIVPTRVPEELMAAARQALGCPTARSSDVIRAALASVAGVDVAAYTPRRTGRPPRERIA